MMHSEKTSTDGKKPDGENKYAPLGLSDHMPFGKHKGKTVQHLIEWQNDYICWLLANTNIKLSDIAMAYLGTKLIPLEESVDVSEIKSKVEQNSQWGCF